ncbi:restriction endonuclease subunit S [Nonomuraea sp. NPDC049695]|uniref:restriction endonuclease subunit S n=1 Tax=Nonomuraea sp. NPDC049695 TaxID=3154734 RepID=UPI0034378ED7
MRSQRRMFSSACRNRPPTNCFEKGSDLNSVHRPYPCLPPGWAATTIGEIAETCLGIKSDYGNVHDRCTIPSIGRDNVRWGRVEIDDVATIEIPLGKRELFRLKPNDLLICKTGDIGRCGIWPNSAGYIAHRDDLHRVRPYNGIDVRYLRYFMEHMSLSGELEIYATGGRVRYLTQKQLRSLRLQLPPYPEQRRIAAALEDHVAHLDAGAAAMARVSERVELLAKRILLEAVPMPTPSHWDSVTVAEAGQVDVGRARHPSRHNGPDMRPYLRVANVYEDHIDTSDLMEMNFPPLDFERYRLEDKDILLNEGQSPEYLGRPAMYRGIPAEVAFTNSLLRFRAKPGVLPEWALLVFRRHLHAGRFRCEARGTTTLTHLTATRLNRVDFPRPPLAEQELIVADVKKKLDAIQRLAPTIVAAKKRAAELRGSLLAEAFAGRLVSQELADEPISVVLERIRAERALRQRVGRTRRGRVSQTFQKEALF